MMFLAINWSLPFWAWILILLGVLIVGFLTGAILIGRLLSKKIQDNPPINENMIRIMYKQMGRTPTEKQVRQVMNAVNSQKN